MEAHKACTLVHGSWHATTAIGDWVRLSLFFAADVLTAWGQPPFADNPYPVLQKAGCWMCHNPEGVASPNTIAVSREGRAPRAEPDQAQWRRAHPLDAGQ